MKDSKIISNTTIKNNKVTCLICDNPHLYDLTMIDERFKLIKCPECDFVFVYPRASVDELIEFYNNDFKYNYEPTPLSKEKAILAVKEFQRILDKFNPNARNILEIGCSYGHMLYGLKEVGYEVYGTEISQRACEYAKRHYGLKIFASEFPPADYIQSFDFIIISQVLEHILNPIDFLKSVSLYLKKNGIVFIGTPNIDCILFDIFKSHFETIKPPEHISFFNSKSIEKLLNQCELKTLKVYTKTTYVWVDWNFYNYLLLSILRKLNILQLTRKKIDPSIKNSIAHSTGITKKSKILLKIKLLTDFVTKILSLLTYPVLKYLDTKRKGLILFAIGKKI